MKTRTQWTREQEDLLRREFPTKTSRQLQGLFPGKTIKAIGAKAKKMRMKKANPRAVFTQEQIEELKRDYPMTQNRILAERYGCSIHSIQNRAFKMNLKKDTEFMREIGRKNFTADHPARKFWIKKGSIAHNKGKKQADYMTAEQIEASKKTHFQKGHLPGNTLYDLAITERTDRRGNKYKWIRIGLAKWMQYHRYLWEQTYGKVPEGCNIQFKDGNTLNCEIDNLYLISRSDQLKNENSFHARYPEEVKTLFYLKSALKRQINKIEKNENNQQTKGNDQ